MSGVGFLAAVKTFAPGGRRRRRCEKQQKVLELPPGYGMQPDVVPSWDAAPPITPPAAFLPPGYKKGFPGELPLWLSFSISLSPRLFLSLSYVGIFLCNKERFHYKRAERRERDSARYLPP